MPDPTSLFDKPDPQLIMSSKENDAAQNQAALRERASAGDKDTLQGANLLGTNVYDEILDSLLGQCQSDDQLLALVSYLSRHQLRASKTLASAVTELWEKAPNRANTSRMLHAAALSDDAEIYRDAVTRVVSMWRNKQMTDVTSLELQALLSSEFWVLSSNARSSGAGFVLKRTLAAARRDLDNN
jgi:hypothetical protein